VIAGRRIGPVIYAGALVAITIPLYALMHCRAPSVSRLGAEAPGGALYG
jgi:hypothetical protein